MMRSRSLTKSSSTGFALAWNASIVVSPVAMRSRRSAIARWGVSCSMPFLTACRSSRNGRPGADLRAAETKPENIDLLKGVNL